MEPVMTTDEASLDLVRRRRAELRESMSALEQALAGPGRDNHWAERVHVALVELSADFREHVSGTEGTDGLYVDLLGTAPRLAGAVARLTAEHATIAGLVEHLLERTATPMTDADIDDVRDLATQLLAQLIRHRQRGADLIYEAYQTDIGGGG